MTAVSGTGESRTVRATATVTRLLEAAASILCAEGAAAVSVQRVATVAGTSKALVHYHFTGKDALLVACIEHLASHLVESEWRAFHASSAATALDDLWRTAMHPRVRAMRRALLALTTDVTPGTRAALERAARERRSACGAAVAQLERLLRFAPTVPAPTLAVALLALIDGLTLDPSADAHVQHRLAFDAFWLAVLSLDH